MAKPVSHKIIFKRGTKKRTSIGDAKASRPKYKGHSRKRSRGQGRP